jgi:hypothetical protein
MRSRRGVFFGDFDAGAEGLCMRRVVTEGFRDGERDGLTQE